MAEEIEKELKNWFLDAKKVVIAGIGNSIRLDDYVGLNIVEKLKGKLARNRLPPGMRDSARKLPL